MGWLPFRICTWPSLRNKTSQGRHAEAIGERAVDPSQRNAGIQLAICEQLTLLVARCIHDTVVQDGEPRRYSIIEKEDGHFRYLEQKHRDKKHSASRERPVVRPVPVAAATEERGQKEQRKRALEMGAQWISEDQCADGKFLFGVKQTTTHESWQFFKNAVRPMWWLRALGCAKMMVNERLVPSRFEILDALQTRVRKKCQEELSTLKMLICCK